MEHDGKVEGWKLYVQIHHSDAVVPSTRARVMRTRRVLGTAQHHDDEGGGIAEVDRGYSIRNRQLYAPERGSEHPVALANIETTHA